jgi:hypothetical protein
MTPPSIRSDGAILRGGRRSRTLGG